MNDDAQILIARLLANQTLRREDKLVKRALSDELFRADLDTRLAACGLLDGGGMTREAALGKLFALLGAGLTSAEVAHWFAVDLCGERAD